MHKRNRKGVADLHHEIAGMRIKGFQTHKETHVQFHEGLSVITGPTGGGKTAIIRAFRWVALGEPKGEAFINEAVGFAEVTVIMKNGIEITKYRKNGSTSYAVSTIEETFDKADVPLEVQQILGITPQTFGSFETTLNFAYQLEAPFLLSEPGSAGAKILGVLAGTEDVDGSIQDISKETHAARDTKKRAEQDIVKINTNLLGFDDLRDWQVRLEECQRLVSVLESDDQKKERLKGYNIGMTASATTIKELDERIQSLAITGSLIEELTQVQKNQQRRATLLVHSRQLKTLTEQMTRLDNQLASYGGLWSASELLQGLSLEQEKVSKLKHLSTSYTGYQQEANAAGVVLQSLAHIGEADALLRDVVAAGAKVERLRKLDVQLGHQRDAVSFYAGRLVGTEKFVEATDILTEIMPATEKLTRIKGLLARLRLYEQDVKTTGTDAYHANLEVTRHENELAKLWDEAGGVCPLCQQTTGGLTHGH